MTTESSDRFGHEVPASALPFLAVIRRAVNAGLTQAQMQERIKASKRARKLPARGIRDDFLRQAIRFVEGVDNINPPPQYKFIERGKSPDTSRLRRAAGITTRQFSYRIGIRDTSTDEITGVIGISSSRRLSRQRILDEALKMIDGNLEQYTSPIPNQFALNIIDAIVSEEFLLSSGTNFSA